MEHNLELRQAIDKRYSCRSYGDKKITGDTLSALQAAIDEVNQRFGLHIQLVLNDGQAFAGFRKSYGLFKGVQNYLALVGPDDEHLPEKVGYYGEILVLKAAALGLGTCWVGGTYKKGDCRCQVNDGEKICCVITIGWPSEDLSFIGKFIAKRNSKRKSMAEMSQVADGLPLTTGSLPDWFRQGMEAVVKAPSAMNAQPVTVTLTAEDKVAISASSGHFTKVDLGIARLHFELGAGPENAWSWETPLP